MPSVPAPRAHFTAGPLAYAAVVVLVAKIARATELCVRLHSARPLWLVPATLGQDLVLVAAIGLAAYALSHWNRPRLRTALALALILPLAILLPADVVSHVLTGAPLTLQRLRGDEGGTLADLDLIDTFDLVGGLLGIAAAIGLLWPALRHAGRIALLRRWARPRALLVTLLLGIGASLVQARFLPRTQGLAGQPVFVLLESLVERRGLGAVSLSASEWRRLLRPSDTAKPPRGVALPSGVRAKNVVIFLAEGIAFEHTGFEPRLSGTVADPKTGQALPNPTPLLTERHAADGVLFDRYYANWHASIQAIFSVVCSAFPPMRGDIVRFKPRIDCGELSEHMKAHGVTTGLFHGGQFSFYNKLALLGRRGYAVELDAEEMGRTSKRKKHQWGIDDRAMVDATLAWVDSLPKGQRFAALLIPITAHYPYWLPRGTKRPFRGSSRGLRFLNAVHFQDAVFGELVRGLERRGLYDDTLFVWLGDHGHYVDEPERVTPGLRGFYEPNLHTALVLLNRRLFGGLTPADRRNHRLGSHVDLLPTILEAMGLPPDPRHQGQSLFARGFEPRRVYFGADDGKYAGFIEESHKFITSTETQHTEYYDLAKDPDELHDLSARNPELMMQHARDAILFARAAQGRIDAAPVLDEDVSVSNVYELFVKHASVNLRRGEQVIRCEGRWAECPGLGRALAIKNVRAQGAKRRCVLVEVPIPPDRIELTIKDRDTLDLLTATIAAIPGKLEDRPSFEIDVSVDGALSDSVLLSARSEEHLRHPQAQRELRLRIWARDAQLPPRPICLQLTTLM